MGRASVSLAVTQEDLRKARLTCRSTEQATIRSMYSLEVGGDCCLPCVFFSVPKMLQLTASPDLPYNPIWKEEN